MHTIHNLVNWEVIKRGPQRVKRDCVIGHISKRENGNWMRNVALLRDRSIWNPAWLDKLGVNWISCDLWAWSIKQNLRESGISRPSWGSLKQTRILGQKTNQSSIFFHYINQVICIRNILLCNPNTNIRLQNMNFI